MNRLAQQRSLYLKQHQDNPVDWWPYSSAAIELAQELDRPIFLSIGYSSCHWCHVMAHESFEDTATAQLLNNHFVCIKLDREEYPDLDQYYQEVCQLLGRSGGWPLSAFLTPKMGPFFVGTYFPREGRHGLPSFQEVLQHIKRIYHEKRAEIEKDSEHIKSVLEAGVRLKEKIQLPGHFPHPQAIVKALDSHLDKLNGGLGGAPKFPHFAFLEWGIEQALEGHLPQESSQFFLYSVDRLLLGGIFDQARGGIHRYSVDEHWLVPHFEKMLYDQAGLLKLLAKVSVFSPDIHYTDALMDTLIYLEKEMLGEDGLFFSSQDADSEGEEGIYFTFTQEEFRAAILADLPEAQPRMEQIERWFQISAGGNFEHQLNMISLNHELKTELLQEENWALIKKIKHALLKARSERIPPHTDTKAVSSWNYHLHSALADVAQFAPLPEIRQKAANLLTRSFPQAQQHFDLEGVGAKHVSTLEETPLYFEDAVAQLEACLRFYEVSGRLEYKDLARKKWELVVEHFVRGKNAFTRPLGQTTLPYPNLALKFFDQSYRSASATFLGVSLRLATLWGGSHWWEKIKDMHEECVQMSLANPLSSGEALRFMTYPVEAFKKLEVPMNFLAMPDFLRLRAHLPQRFVLDYHLRDEESWQICGQTSCEKAGKGAADLLNTLSGNAP